MYKYKCVPKVLNSGEIFKYKFDFGKGNGMLKKKIENHFMHVIFTSDFTYLSLFYMS